MFATNEMTILIKVMTPIYLTDHIVPFPPLASLILAIKWLPISSLSIITYETVFK